VSAAGLFPGQGLPAKVVLQALPERDERLETAREILGYDLRRKVEIAARRDGATLPTLIAQPAIFVAGIIALRHAEDSGRRWDFFAGHSLGEYTALVAGSSVTFADALFLVRARAEAMEEAGKTAPGGMAAVLGLDFDVVADIAARSGAVIANDNSSGQVVLSGSEEDLARAAGMVRSAGARSVLLEVSGPFHSPAMASAARPLADALDRVDVRAPEVPVISNVTARSYEGPREIRAGLVEQLTHTVRFRESLEWLLDQGVEDFDDLGPGRIVAGIASRTARALGERGVAAHA
jgi:[acyl-carrier-protein] S-malonyltransferase